jgi:hypothetical protein
VYRQLLLLAALATLLTAAQPLVREIEFDDPPDDVWRAIVSLARDSGAIVNAMDSAAGLLAMSWGLQAQEARDAILEAKDVPRWPFVAHAVIWRRPVSSNRSRVFVRITLEASAMFFHSNGRLEDELLKAIENASPWRAAPPAAIEIGAKGPEAFAKLSAALAGVGCEIHFANQAEGALACRGTIPKVQLPGFTTSKLMGGHVGAAFITAWVNEPAGTAHLRAMLMELGAFAGPALASNGRLERAISGALRSEPERLLHPISDSSSVTKDVLWKLFESEPLPAGRPAEERDLPARFPEVWQSALSVVTQSAVVAQCDQRNGLLRVLMVHPSPAEDRVLVHPMVAHMEAGQFGTKITLHVTEPLETPDGQSYETQVLAEKVATALFLKEKLKWLQ